MGNIIDRLITETVNDSDEVEMVKYGLKRFIMFLISVIIVAALGLLFEKVIMIGLFMSLFIPLRIFAGGYHSKSLTRCACLSVMFVLCILAIIKWVNFSGYINVLLWGALIVSMITIFHHAPVETDNKRLYKKEIQVFGVIAKIITGVEIILAILFWFLYRPFWVLPALSISAEAIFIFVQILINERKQKGNEND